MQQWQVGPVPDMNFYAAGNPQNDIAQRYNAQHPYPTPQPGRDDRMNNFSFNPAGVQTPQMEVPPVPGQQQPPAPPPPPPTAVPTSIPVPQPNGSAAAAARRNKRPATDVAPISTEAHVPVIPATVGSVPTPIDPNTTVSHVTSESPSELPSIAHPPAKKSRTNTPWTAAEEQRLKQMRDAGSSWAEIAKTFPNRTEGSVKKHWYKDMHYAEFAEDEREKLLAAIKDYENNKWKAIGQKIGKPAKACEQFAKQQFPDLFGATPKTPR